MKQLVKLEVKIMDRSIWVETKETDKDPEFIKSKVEMAIKILTEHWRKNEATREEAV